MYEICALLRTKRVPKPRKPRGPSIGIGAKVIVYGHNGVVTGKGTFTSTWMVSVEGREPVWFNRCVITVVS